MDGESPLTGRIRSAYETADLAALADLLADDVRWGDDDHPNRCRGRDDVLATFSQWMGTGVTADVTDISSGPGGVFLGLHVHWPANAGRARGVDFIHAFMVRDGRIAEIRRYDDRESALEAIA